MTYIAVVLVLASAFCHALWNVISKQQTPSLSFFALVSAAATLILSPIVLLKFKSVVFVIQHYPIEIALTGICQALYFVGLAGAYRHGNFSVSYPLARALPVIFTPLAAFLLFELKFSFIQSLCALGILLGCIAISWPRKTEYNEHLSSSLLHALLAAIGTTGYTLIDQTVLNSLASQSQFNESESVKALIYMWCLSASSMIAMCTILFVSKSGRDAWRDVVSNKKKISAMTAFIMTLTYSLVLIAMHATDNVSYLVALRQSSIVIGVIFGVVFLKENFGKLRCLGLALIMSGIYLMIPIDG
ncbi:hypothetical protein A3762_05955 [Oleiphilus sp. HI0125]|uniref:EamA family transporter n=1 Tax=Oleiphilus sp. HI0125 TaxID=1822266 RepID=UPI0007C28A18|nr:EamA family transporter [Oleiphilus sp. HI0125]KZZ59125.1 hypothetical protein A3762_05955 [Oleiphilus sp. HI0125]